jgi:hypothetical protein
MAPRTRNRQKKKYAGMTVKSTTEKLAKKQVLKSLFEGDGLITCRTTKERVVLPMLLVGSERLTLTGNK